MGAYQQRLTLRIHHFVKVFLIYGYEPLVHESCELCIIMYNGSERVKPSFFLVFAVAKEFFRFAYGPDDAGTES